MRKVFEHFCLICFAISIASSLTGCRIIDDKVADVRKEMEQKRHSNAPNTTEYADRALSDETQTTQSDDNAIASTEDITEVQAGSTQASIYIETGGEKTQISESEWKTAYIDKIQSVKKEYSYVWGYLYDCDDNGIPELIISDMGPHDGESYTYTKDGLISLGNMGGTFGHLYHKEEYLICRASSGGSPGPIWVTTWKFDGTKFLNVTELEFDYKLGDDGKPKVTGAGSYDEAVNILEGYGMSASFTDMKVEGETYCQVEVDTSGLESLVSYENDEFVAAVENFDENKTTSIQTTEVKSEDEQVSEKNTTEEDAENGMCVYPGLELVSKQ